LRGLACGAKNAKKVARRCKFRFHAPKGYPGNPGSQPKYMRKDKDEFEEDEDEYEDWDQAAWDAFICAP
jgi:hypothetical protein